MCTVAAIQRRVIGGSPHQTIRVHMPTGSRSRFAEGFRESLSIPIVNNNVFVRRSPRLST
jgi:hypothetical protein